MSSVVEVDSSHCLRQGEALGLQWKDVDLEPGLLQSAITSAGRYQARPVEPETDRCRRSLVVPPSIVERLRDRAKQQLADKIQGWIEAWAAFARH
jgi:integrase